MSEDLVAIAQVSPAPPASDYDTIFAALMQSERGRWFLQEYARRNRSADTKLLLSAIERIEAAVCADRNRPIQHNFRSDLMEMAEAITQTRAEVAELRTEASAPGPQPRTPARQPPGDVFAAAERIRDVTWAMRGHGFDPGTCEQLEELAAAILSASALRDPTDSRARKLGEVLAYLEQRITRLIDSCAEGDAPDGQAHAPAGAEKRLNGAASPVVTQSRASEGAEDVGSPRIRIPGSLTAVHDDIGDDVTVPPAAAELALLEHDPEKACPRLDRGWIPVFGNGSCSTHNVEPDDDLEKSDPALEAPLPAAAGDASSAPGHESDAWAADAWTANSDPDVASSADPHGSTPAALAASPAALTPPVTAAEPALPGLPREAEAAIAAFGAELAGLEGASPAPKQLPPPPAPQRPIDDPLAQLRAMSADELIALFS